MAIEMRIAATIFSFVWFCLAIYTSKKKHPVLAFVAGLLAFMCAIAALVDIAVP